MVKKQWKTVASAQLLLCTCAAKHLVVGLGSLVNRACSSRHRAGKNKEKLKPSGISTSFSHTSNHNNLQKVMAATSLPPSKSHIDFCFAQF